MNRPIIPYLSSNDISAQWCISYSSHAPNLQNLAFKIISLTCCSLGCEINWNIFQHESIKLLSLNTD